MNPRVGGSTPVSSMAVSLYMQLPVDKNFTKGINKIFIIKIIYNNFYYYICVLRTTGDPGSYARCQVRLEYARN